MTTQTWHVRVTAGHHHQPEALTETLLDLLEGFAPVVSTSPDNVTVTLIIQAPSALDALERGTWALQQSPLTLGEIQQIITTADTHQSR